MSEQLQERECGNQCCDCNGNTVSVKAEKTLLHDLVKTAVMGVQAIDVVEEYVYNQQFKSFVVEQKDTYRHYSALVNDYMRAHGIDEDFYGNIQQAFTKGMLKMGAIGTNSDSRVAEQLIKGTNMGIDTLAKNINSPEGISTELLSMTKEFSDFMMQSLDELRKWL